MAGSQQYTSKVMNRSGYVVMLPNVADMDDLLQTNPPNPYAQSSTQLFPLGTKLVQGERSWRYAKAGAGIAIGVPVQSAAPVHAEQIDDIVTAAVSAIGAYTVTLTSTANLDGSPNNVANDFAEGYLIVNDEAGEKQCYKIKSNEALVTTGNSIFTLYDPLTVALSTASQCGLARNPYYRVITSAAVCSALLVGAAQLAVTDAYWFWLQTGGPAGVIAHAAIAVGDLVVAGTTAAKADPAAALETTEAVLGRAMTAAIADTESFICFLSCDPG